MVKQGFSLKGIKRMVLGLGLVALAVLGGVLTKWGNSQFKALSLDQHMVFLGILGLLLWCLITHIMIESQEERL